MKSKVLALGILLLSFTLILFLRGETALVKLLYCSLGLILMIKISALFFEKRLFKTKLGLFCYLFLWPGISAEGFLERKKLVDSDTGKRFFEHWMTFLFGFFLLCLSTYIGRGEIIIWNYISLLSILLILHLGLIEVLRDILKLLGFSPNMMFDRPYVAISLRDFWSHRWNRAFVEMNKIFFVKPLRNKVPAGLLTFSIFLLSGILHEIAISFSAGVAFGGPLLYFFIQGIGFVIEKKFKLGRLISLMIIVLPIPLLFPPEFVNQFLGGLSKFLIFSYYQLLDYGVTSGLLKLGALLQAIVLLASIQVPGKLNWKNEFQKLTPFNRKVFWTYGGYIFCIIIYMIITSFTLSLEDKLNIPSLLWVAFIFLFWVARVGIDMFYYSHADWPKGAEFVIGHICLTTLFSTLVGIYAMILYLEVF